jgi:hypothetical protein
MEYQIFLAFLVGVLVGTSFVFFTQEDENDLLVIAEQRGRREALEGRRRDRAA